MLQQRRLAHSVGSAARWWRVGRVRPSPSRDDAVPPIFLSLRVFCGARPGKNGAADFQLALKSTYLRSLWYIRSYCTSRRLRASTQDLEPNPTGSNESRRTDKRSAKALVTAGAYDGPLTCHVDCQCRPTFGARRIRYCDSHDIQQAQQSTSWGLGRIWPALLRTRRIASRYAICRRVV